jgi:hypothetical protein
MKRKNLDHLTESQKREHKLQQGRERARRRYEAIKKEK